MTNIFFNIYQYYEPKIKFNNNLTNIIIKIGKNENKNFLDIQNINHIDSFDMINNIDTIINYKNITEDYYSKILNKKYRNLKSDKLLSKSSQPFLIAALTTLSFPICWVSLQKNPPFP